MTSNQKEQEERTKQLLEDKARASTYRQQQVGVQGPGGRFAAQANAEGTLIKGGHGPGAGPWSGNDPNPLEPPFGIDINFVPPVE
jgi:hypothetical protein